MISRLFNSLKNEYEIPIPWRMYITIGALWFLMVCIVIYGFYTAMEINIKYPKLINAAGVLKTESTAVRLLFNDIFLYRKNIDIDNLLLLSHLRKIEISAGILTGEAFVFHGLFGSKKDTDERMIVNRINEHVEELKQIIEAVKRRENIWQGEEIKKQYNVILHAIVFNAEDAGTSLAQLKENKVKQYKNTQVALLIISLFILLLAVLIFRRFEHNKGKDIFELNRIKRALEKKILGQKHTEEALKENELRYRSLVEHTDNAVAIYEAVNNGEDFNIKDFNRKAEAVEKIKREDIIGRPVTEVFPGVKDFGIFDVFRRVWETGKPENFPLGFYKDNRLSGWRDNYVYKLPNGEIVAVYKDESDRMKILEEREILIKELGNKNQELEYFTYMVSHDLKSPLITIQGYLKLIEKNLSKDNSADIKDDIKKINNAAERMGRLLDELLKVSRAGRLVDVRGLVSFDKLVKEALESLNGQLTARNARIDIAHDLPAVYADGSRVHEMLMNLIDNALKYSDKTDSRIEIGFHKNSDEIIYYVRDNGIGIDPVNHEIIFGLFNKLDPDSEGTGAGLAIVKRIVEAHGGRIWVESEGLGQGSTFCFTFTGSSSKPV